MRETNQVRERINLLYLIPSLGTGGTERLVADLVTRLDPCRFHVSVCVQDDKGEGELVRRELAYGGYGVRNLGASINGRRARPVDKLRSFGKRVACLRAILEREQIDLLHTHHLGPLLHALLAGLRTRPWRWVHTEHIRPDVDAGYPRWLVCLGRRMFSSTDVVTGVSDAVGAYFRDNAGVPGERVMVIHNGVDVERFAAQYDGAAKRRDLGIPLDAWVIGLVANLRPQKNHELLLQAFARLLPRVPEARVVLAGDGVMRGTLDALARELAIRDRVHFLGSRSDVPELFSTFDVYCLPSHYEGMPLTLFEAMAAGKPVVATRVVGIREVVADGETGLLVSHDDPDALAGALMRVRQDAGLGRELAGNGRRYVNAHARLGKMVSRYAALYEQVLAA